MENVRDTYDKNFAEDLTHPKYDCFILQTLLVRSRVGNT